MRLKFTSYTCSVSFSIELQTLIVGCLQEQRIHTLRLEDCEFAGDIWAVLMAGADSSITSAAFVSTTDTSMPVAARNIKTSSMVSKLEICFVKSLATRQIYRHSLFRGLLTSQHLTELTLSDINPNTIASTIRLAGKRLVRLDLGDDIENFGSDDLPIVQSLSIDVLNGDTPMVYEEKFPRSLISLELRCAIDWLQPLCVDLQGLGDWCGPRFRHLTVSCEEIKHRWSQAPPMCSIAVLSDQCERAGIILNVKAGDDKLVDNGDLHESIVKTCAECGHMWDRVGGK